MIVIRKCMFLYLLLSANLLFAQSDTQQKHFYRELYLTAGVNHLFLNDINDRLSNINTENLGKTMVSAGMGMAFGSKLMFGVETNFGYTFNGSTNSANVIAYFSTNTLKTSSIIFAPRLGIGWQTVSHKLSKEGVGGNFDSVIRNTPNQVKIYHPGSILEIGLVVKRTARDSHTYPIAMIGYRKGLTKAQWKIEDYETSNGPKEFVNSLFVSIFLGRSNR